MAEINSAEVWSSKLQGVTSHGSYGPRDVLIISSSHLSISDPEVVPRNVGELTEKDVNRLTNEGIPLECQADECKLMEARYSAESSRFKKIVVLNGHLTKEDVLSKIEAILANSTQPGGKSVTIYFAEFYRYTYIITQ